MVAGFLVHGLVLGLVLGLHIPVEAIHQARLVKVILDPLKLLLPRKSALGVDQVVFGLGHEPVGQRVRYIGVFLFVAGASEAAGHGGEI